MIHFRFWWESCISHTEHDCFLLLPQRLWKAALALNEPNTTTVHAATTMNICLASTMLLTILWTFAIMLLPDESSSAASAQRVDGLVVNGNHYVLDTNIDQTRSGNGSYRVIRAVNVKTPRNTKKRVSTRYHVCASVVPCFAVSYPPQTSFSESKSCCDE